jgi:hypothetical protein
LIHHNPISSFVAYWTQPGRVSPSDCEWLIPNAHLKSYCGMFHDENGPFEVFWSDQTDPCGEGFYWWPLGPDGLPNGDSEGPFATSDEAYWAARELDFSSNHVGFGSPH